jgi:hypothetical protein
MRAWIACLVVACLAAAPAASDAADHKPAPRPGVLWQQYPLGTVRLTGATPTSPAPVAPAQRLGGRTTPGASADTSLWLPIALWAAGLVLLALTGGASLYVRSRRRAHLEESLAEPMAEIVLATARLESRRLARGGSHRDAAGHTITPNRGREATSENVDDRGTGQEKVQEAKASQAVSDRVSEVIKAAEEVRTAADAEAAEIRRAVELYATDHRRSAEAGIKVLSEAEAQVRAMREAAEQMAMQDELLDATQGKGGTLLEALSVDGEKASDEVKEETAPTDTVR